MGLPPFFDRVYAAAGGVLSLSRDSLEEQLRGIRVGVELDPHWEHSPAARYSADLAVNMAARLYGDLSVRGPYEWAAAAIERAKAINPNLSISDADASYSVVAGNVVRSADAVYMRSDGWVARVLGAPAGSAPGPSNPFAAGMAAGLAMAELFRRVFRARLGEQSRFEGCSVSLLDFSSSTGDELALESARIGDVALAGIGAVGNAAVSALSQLTRLEGRILLVDGQCIDLGNLQRYVLATFRDQGSAKVELAAAALKSTGVQCDPRQLAFEDAAEVIALPEVIAVSVDNIPTRRAVQALLPRIAINGWTSELGLGASSHEFGGELPCLACDYHPRGPTPSQWDVVMRALGLSRDRLYKLWLTEDGVDDADLEIVAAHLKIDRSCLESWRGQRIQDFFTSVACGQVALDLSSGRGPQEAVPLAHQSVISGILMASELVKRTDATLREKSQRAPMIVWDNILQRAPKRWTVMRAPASGCICRDEIFQRRYQAKWSGAREDIANDAVAKFDP